MKVTFERGFKRARMKAAAEENDQTGQKPPAKTPKTVAEPGAATAGSPLSLEHWVMLARNFSNVLKVRQFLINKRTLKANPFLNQQKTHYVLGRFNFIGRNSSINYK